MNINTISRRNFRSIYWQTQLINTLMLAGAYLLLRSELITPALQDYRRVASSILNGIIILAVIHVIIQRRKLDRIIGMANFDEKLEAYERFFRIRMLWFFFSTLIASLLWVATGRYTYLYYGIFLILSSLPYYPSKFMFRKELKEESVVID